MKAATTCMMLGLTALAAAVGYGIGVSRPAGVWPSQPVFAGTAVLAENSVLATMPLDEANECVVFLDELTGTLRGAMPSNRTGKFIAFYERKVAEDFLQLGAKNPKYMLATGSVDSRRGAGLGNLQPANGVAYVADVNSGIVIAYNVLWSNSAMAANQPVVGEFNLLDVRKFRQEVVRSEVDDDAPPAKTSKKGKK